MGHAIEVAFEGIDVRRPEAAKGFQPCIDLLERLRFQAVEAALRIDRGLDEAGLAQHAQMLGDGGLGDAEAALNLAHGLLGGDEQGENGATVGLRDDFEDRFHTRDIRHMVYTCQEMYAKLKTSAPRS